MVTLFLKNGGTELWGVSETDRDDKRKQFKHE